MRLDLRYLIGLLVIASTTGCGNVTQPTCAASCDAALVVYGRASVDWSGMAVPGATVTVRLFADTARAVGNCAGTTPFVTTTQAPDSTGNFRLSIAAAGAASRWACVEVTADPHNWASDVGLNRVSGGVIQLRAAPDGGPSDSLRVDVHYSELS